jgi:hypothetical protein
VGRWLPMRDEDARAGSAVLQEAGPPLLPEQPRVALAVPRRREVLGEVPHPGARLALHRARMSSLVA